MKLFSNLVICIAFVFTGYGQSKIVELKPLKIACIGNSITYGAGMVNREKNAYPQQLQVLLGDEYVVKNFGVNGNTLLKKGDYPYWKSEKYQEALEFTPDIVYFKLGTNDAKKQNRINLESNFKNDYKEFIQSFKEKNKNVRIVILLPVPSFLDDSTSIWNPVIKINIIPLIQKVAYDTKSEVIDLYQLFVGESHLFPDHIHPSSLGASRIARRLYENVIQNTADKDKRFDLFKMQDIKQNNFYGFVQNNFKFKKIPCKIVEPIRSAEGKPWVLRARFFGHEPQTDVALLERGFHIAYCDVADLFGNEEAVQRWSNFYQFMSDNGFSKKVVLEGMSRGGLIVYNWAAKNPEKVACVYADAPVLDITSWPGGRGKGVGSPGDWGRFKEVYGLSLDDAVLGFDGDPIHKIEAIVKGGYPMLHVCGEADNVVPVDENTRMFEKKIKEAGGNIEVIYKRDVGHHPHSLQNPTPIVDFILRATNRKVNFAGIPSPGSDYRSAAGWKEGKDWWAQMEDIDSLCKSAKDLDILFIGNSITQGWGGGRTLITYRPGQIIADAYFKGLNYVNAGISGDRTEHILWRIKNGHYNTNIPKMVTMAIGVNNFSLNSADEISAGIIKVVEMMEQTFPESKILFFGPLPTGIDKNSEQRKKYNAIHKTIAFLDKKPSIYYFNLVEQFSDENGNLRNTYYGEDGIHLREEGYKVWGKFIREKYEEYFIK